MTRIKPPEQRRGRGKPVRGEFHSAPGIGWQHGALPEPPAGLLPASRQAWQAWMSGWRAAHWTPGDVPGLRVVIRLYDRVQRGEFTRASELRMWEDTYGITPKGADDRRWSPPKPEAAPDTPPAPTSGSYAHLRALEGPKETTSC